MKKFLIILLLLTLYPQSSKALIIDMPEIVLKVINVVNEKAVLIQKQYQSYQTLKTEIKSGILGTDTFKMFKSIQRGINTAESAVMALDRKFEVSVFHGFYEVLNMAEQADNKIKENDAKKNALVNTAELSAAVKENFVTQLEETGNTKALEQRRELDDSNTRNMVSELYARALATRFAIETQRRADEESSENKSEDQSTESRFEDKTEVLTEIRMVIGEILNKKANVLHLEAGLLEYRASSFLKTQGIQSSTSSDETPEKIMSSEEYLNE